MHTVTLSSKLDTPTVLVLVLPQTTWWCEAQTFHRFLDWYHAITLRYSAASCSVMCEKWWLNVSYIHVVTYIRTCLLVQCWKIACSYHVFTCNSRIPEIVGLYAKKNADSATLRMPVSDCSLPFSQGTVARATYRLEFDSDWRDG